ncbi:MAG: hypothetical protein V3581_04340 [Candidatus Cardinium sp.]|nr:hypothetical protein [Candidatus Cardinium sp.]
MLKCLCAHKDIANIIHRPYTKIHANNLLIEAAKVDKHAAEEIYTILTNAGCILTQI